MWNYQSLCDLSVTIFLLGLQSVASRAVLRVEIVSWGLPGSAAKIALAYTNGPMQSGMSLIRELYKNKIDFTHTYLRNPTSSSPNPRDCSVIDQHMDFMASEWYYKRSADEDLAIFIAPCKKIWPHLLAASWNILLLTRYVILWLHNPVVQKPVDRDLWGNQGARTWFAR